MMSRKKKEDPAKKKKLLHELLNLKRELAKKERKLKKIEELSQSKEDGSTPVSQSASTSSAVSHQITKPTTISAVQTDKNKKFKSLSTQNKNEEIKLEELRVIDNARDFTAPSNMSADARNVAEKDLKPFCKVFADNCRLSSPDVKSPTYKCINTCNQIEQNERDKSALSPHNILIEPGLFDVCHVSTAALRGKNGEICLEYSDTRITNSREVGPMCVSSTARNQRSQNCRRINLSPLPENELDTHDHEKCLPCFQENVKTEQLSQHAQKHCSDDDDGCTENRNLGSNNEEIQLHLSLSPEERICFSDCKESNSFACSNNRFIENKFCFPKVNADTLLASFEAINSSAESKSLVHGNDNKSQNENNANSESLKKNDFSVDVTQSKAIGNGIQLEVSIESNTQVNSRKYAKENQNKYNLRSALLPGVIDKSLGSQDCVTTLDDSGNPEKNKSYFQKRDFELPANEFGVDSYDKMKGFKQKCKSEEISVHPSKPMDTSADLQDFVINSHPNDCTNKINASSLKNGFCIFKNISLEIDDDVENPREVSETKVLFRDDMTCLFVGIPSSMNKNSEQDSFDDVKSETYAHGKGNGTTIVNLSMISNDHCPKDSKDKKISKDQTFVQNSVQSSKDINKFQDRVKEVMPVLPSEVHDQSVVQQDEHLKAASEPLLVSPNQYNELEMQVDQAVSDVSSKIKSQKLLDSKYVEKSDGQNSKDSNVNVSHSSTVANSPASHNHSDDFKFTDILNMSDFDVTDEMTTTEKVNNDLLKSKNDNSDKKDCSDMFKPAPFVPLSALVAKVELNYKRTSTRPTKPMSTNFSSENCMMNSNVCSLSNDVPKPSAMVVCNKVLTGSSKVTPNEFAKTFNSQSKFVNDKTTCSDASTKHVHYSINNQYISPFRPGAVKRYSKDCVSGLNVTPVSKRTNNEISGQNDCNGTDLEGVHFINDLLMAQDVEKGLFCESDVEIDNFSIQNERGSVDISNLNPDCFVSLSTLVKNNIPKHKQTVDKSSVKSVRSTSYNVLDSHLEEIEPKDKMMHHNFNNILHDELSVKAMADESAVSVKEEGSISTDLKPTMTCDRKKRVKTDLPSSNNFSNTTNNERLSCKRVHFEISPDSGKIASGLQKNSTWVNDLKTPRAMCDGLDNDLSTQNISMLLSDEMEHYCPDGEIVHDKGLLTQNFLSADFDSEIQQLCQEKVSTVSVNGLGETSNTVNDVREELESDEDSQSRSSEPNGKELSGCRNMRIECGGCIDCNLENLPKEILSVYLCGKYMVILLYDLLFHIYGQVEQTWDKAFSYSFKEGVLSQAFFVQDNCQIILALIRETCIGGTANVFFHVIAGPNNVIKLDMICEALTVPERKVGKEIIVRPLKDLSFISAAAYDTNSQVILHQFLFSKSGELLLASLELTCDVSHPTAMCDVSDWPMILIFKGNDVTVWNYDEDRCISEIFINEDLLPSDSEVVHAMYDSNEMIIFLVVVHPESPYVQPKLIGYSFVANIGIQICVYSCITPHYTRNMKAIVFRSFFLAVCDGSIFIHELYKGKQIANIPAGVINVAAAGDMIVLTVATGCIVSVYFTVKNMNTEEGKIER